LIGVSEKPNRPKHFEIAGRDARVLSVIHRNQGARKICERKKNRIQSQMEYISRVLAVKKINIHFLRKVDPAASLAFYLS